VFRTRSTLHGSSSPAATTTLPLDARDPCGNDIPRTASRGPASLNRDHGTASVAAPLVILSDGWTRGDPDELAGRRCPPPPLRDTRLVWLNPLKAHDGYEPLPAACRPRSFTWPLLAGNCSPHSRSRRPAEERCRDSGAWCSAPCEARASAGPKLGSRGAGTPGRSWTQNTSKKNTNQVHKNGRGAGGERRSATARTWKQERNVTSKHSESQTHK